MGIVYTLMPGSIAYNFLFWFLTLGTCTSGSFFIFKWPGLYRPDAYIVNGKPGTGETDFEQIATFVFGLVYLTPIVGFIYAHVEGSKSARRAAAIAPMLYHFGSTYGVLCVFGAYLNPLVAKVFDAAAMHLVMGVLFLVNFIWAFDNDDSDDSYSSLKKVN